MHMSFDRIGPDLPLLPVVLSVPHAGRAFPPTLETPSRVDLDQLISLEDRYADLLVNDAAQSGFSGLVARTPRAIIDLNRAEQDLDPGMVTPAPVRPLPLSAKARGGLGLVPRRTAALGEIWTRKFSAAEIEQRLADHHRPYHETLAALLAEAKARHGAALLLDIHSMPPLADTAEGKAPDLVIGDRFGRSADPRLSDHVRAFAQDWGLRTARNAPYAGGHILDRHGAPHRQIHALQIEFDRRLYLEPNLVAPAERASELARFLTALAQSLADELSGASALLAAE